MGLDLTGRREGVDLAIRVIQWLDTGEDGEVWQCAVVGREEKDLEIAWLDAGGDVEVWQYAVVGMDAEGSEGHLSFLTMLLSYSITCPSASEQRAKVKRNFQGPITYSVRGQ